MKNLAKSVLTLFFVLVSFIFVIFVTLRFQLLDSNFWKTTFRSNNTYSALVTIIQSDVVSQVVAQGGKKSDVKILTDLVTEDNLKNFIDKNIDNSLNFANGKTQEMLVYIPFGRVPKSLLPLSLSKINEEIRIQDLLTKMNITSVNNSQIQKIHSLGLIVNIILVFSIAILAVAIFFFYKLTESGKRFSTPGTALLLSGILIFVLSKLLGVMNTTLKFGISQGMNPTRLVVATIASPVITEVSKIWLIESAILTGFGIILFFIRKQYTKSE
jgi:hypothetical protein